MIGGGIARRYARALVEIAREDGTLKEVCDEILELDSLLRTEEELSEILGSPIHKASEKEALFSKIAEASGLSRTVTNFVQLIISKGRMALFDSIALSVRDLSDEALSRVRAEITVPVPLEDQAVSQIKASISRKTGKKVLLETKHAPEIIGGIKARIGNTLYDYSISNDLKKLREKMERGA